MKAKPLNDRVLVRRKEITNEMVGSLYLPETAKEKPQEGIVESYGMKVTQVTYGDKVLFGKYSGTDIKIKDEDFIILKEEEILAVLED